MGHSLDVGLSWLASAARLAGGMTVARTLGPRPAVPLTLFEFEGCPFCRKVREAITFLDLEVDVRPCPKGGTRYRAEVQRLGGKAQFPFLIDPNAGLQLYESGDIIRHLVTAYGPGALPLTLKLGPVTLASSVMASALRPGGSRARPSRLPGQPLELASFEASPYCRLVRERLCELELPYRLRSVGKKSPSRPAFVARSGKMQVPWLFDPNTGTGLFESADICAYLDRTYGAP